MKQKSTIEEIRARFDEDVDRFSNLETGQAAAVDSPLMTRLAIQAACAATPNIERVLDIGCGAGNYSLRLLMEYEEDFACDLNDLSLPMLHRAAERVSAATSKEVHCFQGDFREISLGHEQYDVILAASVLHHLREDADWEAAFAKIYRLLKPGGSVWITDLIAYDDPGVHAIMWKRYGDYLEAAGGPSLRELVFDYIDQEDSPRPLSYQLNLLREVGFSRVDVLHCNSCFAAFGGVK